MAVMPEPEQGDDLNRGPRNSQSPNHSHPARTAATSPTNTARSTYSPQHLPPAPIRAVHTPHYHPLASRCTAAAGSRTAARGELIHRMLRVAVVAVAGHIAMGVERRTGRVVVVRIGRVVAGRTVLAVAGRIAPAVVGRTVPVPAGHTAPAPAPVPGVADHTPEPATAARPAAAHTPQTAAFPAVQAATHTAPIAVYPSSTLRLLPSLTYHRGRTARSARRRIGAGVVVGRKILEGGRRLGRRRVWRRDPLSVGAGRGFSISRSSLWDGRGGAGLTRVKWAYVFVRSTRMCGR